jgi:hypothetical protein
MSQQYSRTCIAFVGLVAGLGQAPLQAQAPVKLDISARLVPADAPFYSAWLRNREQYEALVNSRAFTAIKELPALQSAWQVAELFLGMPGGPLDRLQQLKQDPENRELLELLADAVADEIFCTGGTGAGDLFLLMERLNNANRFAPLLAMLQGPQNLGGPLAIQRSAALQKALLANRELIKTPELVMGFKLRNTGRAEAQLKRLEKLVAALAAQEAAFQGRLKRVTIQGAEFLTLKLDGGMVPWESLPLWDALGDDAAQFEPLIKHLKSLQLTISAGVRDGYLLVGIGEATAAVAALGTGGQRLIDRPELRPLHQHAAARLTSVSYTSPSYRAGRQAAAFGVESLLGTLRDNLPPGAIPEKLRLKIEKQLRKMAAEPAVADPGGAELSFSYLTGVGSESWTYDWSKQHNLDGSKPLSLLNHVGGNPLLAVVARSKHDPQEYTELVEFVKMVGELADEWVESQPDDLKRQYAAWNKALRPLLKRLDEVTGQLLLPALADGQVAFVLDAKWKSAQWHQAMPPVPGPLPMLEIGLVFGVSDAPRLEKAMKGYAAILEDLAAKIGEVAPDTGVQRFKFPEPKTQAAAAGRIFTWPLPPAVGLDARVAPSAGLSEKVAVVTASAGHAERLLQATPLAPESQVLGKALKKPLATAAHLDWAGVIEAVTPWVELAAHTIARAQTGEDAGDDTMRQLRTVLDVLKCFRGTSSVSYVENGAVVTHSETLFRDLPRR